MLIFSTKHIGTALVPLTQNSNTNLIIPVNSNTPDCVYWVLTSLPDTQGPDMQTTEEEQTPSRTGLDFRTSASESRTILRSNNHNPWLSKASTPGSDYTTLLILNTHDIHSASLHARLTNQSARNSGPVLVWRLDTRRVWHWSTIAHGHFSGNCIRDGSGLGVDRVHLCVI